MTDRPNKERARNCGLVAQKAADIIEQVLPSYFPEEDDKRRYQIFATMVLIDVTEHVPMRLEAMLSDEADDPSIIHDVQGCLKGWDPSTATMKDCFLPRYAEQ